MHLTREVILALVADAVLLRYLEEGYIVSFRVMGTGRTRRCLLQYALRKVHSLECCAGIMMLIVTSPPCELLLW